MGKYPSKGSLVTSGISVTFDPNSGLTYFSGLSITKMGMYLLSVKIFSTGKVFDSQCYSNAITVYDQSTALLVNKTPNCDFKYKTTNYSAINGDFLNEMKTIIFNYLHDLNYTVANVQINASSSAASRKRRDTATIVSYDGTITVVLFSTSPGNTLTDVLSRLNISSYVVLYTGESKSTDSSSSSSWVK